MGGRTGKTLDYLGAAPGAPESGATPQQVVAQAPTGAQPSAASQVAQGTPTPNTGTVQQG